MKYILFASAVKHSPISSISNKIKISIKRMKINMQNYPGAGERKILSSEYIISALLGTSRKWNDLKMKTERNDGN